MKWENVSHAQNGSQIKTIEDIPSSNVQDYTYNAYPAAYHWTHSMCCMDLLVPGDFITVQVLQEDADLTGGLRSVGYNTPHLTIAGG